MLIYIYLWYYNNYYLNDDKYKWLKQLAVLLLFLVQAVPHFSLNHIEHPTTQTYWLSILQTTNSKVFWLKLLDFNSTYTHIGSWTELPHFWTKWPTLSRGQFQLWWRHYGRDSVSNHQPHDYLLNRLFRRRSERTSKLRVTGLCAGNSPVIGEFPAQMASNAENVSIWWRHHVLEQHPLCGVAWMIDIGFQYKFHRFFCNTGNLSTSLVEVITWRRTEGRYFQDQWLFCNKDDLKMSPAKYRSFLLRPPCEHAYPSGKRKGCTHCLTITRYIYIERCRFDDLQYTQWRWNCQNENYLWIIECPNYNVAGPCVMTVIWRCLNTLRPRQNGRHFADDTFKHIFLNENVRISIKISLKFVPKGPTNDG